jgi:amidohydrolase
VHAFYYTDQLLIKDNVISDANVSDHATLLAQYRPNMTVYENFYRDVHQNPELSGLESHTASMVASQLESLGDFTVHSHIGGYGVVGVLENGPGKTVLIRAELDALPTLEQTNLSYASRKRMVDRYGSERPVMHACGHDMNMAALLAAATLLKAAKSHWSGTLIVLFQPDEEETGGAEAMVQDGLYSKIPIPDIMLAQHVTPLKSGLVAIRDGPVLMAADSLNVRVFGGPCPGVNPQFCEDPIAIATHLITRVPGLVKEELGPDELATVACWGFHAGIPGADFVYEADLLLDIKTWKPDVREKVLHVVATSIEAECKALNAPKSPSIISSVRAPLTRNSPSIVEPIHRAFSRHFGQNAVEMEITPATEDFSTLQGPHNIPYAYWNFGGSPEAGGESDIPKNHSPFFAPAIQPTLQSGTDAMALAVLCFLG